MIVLNPRLFITTLIPARLTDPENRLTNKKIAHYFLDLRIGRQPLPKIDIFGSTESKPREKQTTLSHRPFAVVHYVGRPRKTLFVDEIRKHVFHCQGEAPPVGRFESPQIFLRRRQDLRDRRHSIEIEKRIAIWLRPPQFLWKAAVLVHLSWDDHGLEPCAAVFE